MELSSLKKLNKTPLYDFPRGGKYFNHMPQLT